MSMVCIECLCAVLYSAVLCGDQRSDSDPKPSLQRTVCTMYAMLLYCTRTCCMLFASDKERQPIKAQNDNNAHPRVCTYVYFNDNNLCKRWDVTRPPSQPGFSIPVLHVHHTVLFKSFHSATKQAKRVNRGYRAWGYYYC